MQQNLQKLEYQLDTVDQIEPEAVLACMQIAEQFILDIDKPA